MEPEAKKSKMSESDRTTYSFTKEGKPCDRTLIINHSAYRVNSETLIEHSDYFRVMFTSNFMEKDRTAIELKEVEEEEFRMFLSVLFEPEKQEVTQNNLPSMGKVFVFFQATQYLVDFLKEKEVFELIPAADLLELSLEQVVPVLKDAVENWLIEKFEKLEAIGGETMEDTDNFGYHPFNFVPFIIECLDLVSAFKLKELKKKIEARLLTEYKQSKHNSSAEDEYVELLIKYGLEDLKEVVEEYAMGLERSGYLIASIYLYKYYHAAKPLIMNKLKDSVEEYLLQVIRYGETIWDIIRNYYSGDPKDQMAKLRKSWEFPGLIKYLETSHDNDLHKLKALIEEWVLEGESALVNEHSIRDYLELSQYSNRIKEVVEQFLIKQYRESTNLTNEDYSSYEDDCDRYELKQLEDVIENDLIEEFTAGENPQKFEDHNMICRLLKLKLKEAIESPLIEQLNTDGEKDSEFLQKCFDYSTKYDMDNLKKAFDEYLLNEFEDTRSFKNIKFAFADWKGYLFKSKFKQTVIDFLQTVDYDDDYLKTCRKYILELPWDQNKLVLEALLRKPDEEVE